MWSFLHFAANWLMQATGSPWPVKTLFSWQLLLAQSVSICCHWMERTERMRGFVLGAWQDGWVQDVGSFYTKARSFAMLCCKWGLLPTRNHPSSFAFISRARERERDILCFFIHSLPMAGRQVVQWDKRPIYVPNGKLMLLGNSEHVQRMAIQTQRHPRLLDPRPPAMNLPSWSFKYDQTCASKVIERSE